MAEGDIELVQDKGGLAVIGQQADVERFMLNSGLADEPSRPLDLHRLYSLANTAGAASGVAGIVAENSGRWVKLTAESAKAVHKFGLMATKQPGVSHAMIGKPGDIHQWLQIAQAPTALLAGPLALTALSTMMQQRALQQQMDEIVDYLQRIDEKVDDILRAQKDAVLADMVGVDLVIEEALTVRDQVGRVSDVTWSKVQATGATLARTQAYAVRQLEAIAEKLEKDADLRDVAKATTSAEPKVREWLAVIARCFALQEGAAVLELDRVLDSDPEDVESHRLGLTVARKNRVDLITSITSRLLVQMDSAVRRANSKVFLNPFEAPAAVRSSSRVASDVVLFRDRLGIQTDEGAWDAKLWRQAADELRRKVATSATSGAGIAADAFRKIDTDGDGEADTRKVQAAARDAGAAVKEAASGVSGALGVLFSRSKDETPESGKE